MVPNIPSQTVSGMGKMSIEPFLDLWPELTDDSDCDQGLLNESRNLLIWWDDNRLRIKWPKRFGEHQELADELTAQLQSLIYSDFNQEFVEGLIGIKLPPLKVNVPAKSQVVMRARFTTERLLAYMCEFTEGNRTAHLDDVVGVPVDIDPVRYSIADTATEFFNDGRPLSQVHSFKPDFLYAWDPRGAYHRAPPMFDGDRHVLLLEHVRSRYLLDALVKYYDENRNADSVGINLDTELDSGLIVPLSDSPGEPGFDQDASMAVRMFCKGFFESRDLGRKFEREAISLE